MPEFIAPGAMVGIIGGDIRAYQLALAARQIGMRVAVLAETADALALQAAHVQLVGLNKSNYVRLQSVCSVVTFSDEKVVDADLLSDLFTPRQLASGTDILAMTQDRYLEKIFFEDLNLNVLPYGQVIAPDDIDKTVAAVGYPSVLKPIQTGLGVDQQLLIESDVDVWRARGLLQKRPYILEAWLDTPRELVVTCVRTPDGLQVFPVVENQMAKRVVKATLAPAPIEDAVVMEILRIAENVSARINYYGVFALEFFYTKEGSLYIKQLAPGPSQGGDALQGIMPMTQYDLHMRTILGWPVPTMRVSGEAVLLPLVQDQMDAVITQIQIKPDWYWRFYPAGSALAGYVIVPGPIKQALISIDATKMTTQI